MAFNQLSASLIQSAARRLLSLDPESSRQLNQFEQKVIQLQIDDFNMVYFFSFENGQVNVAHSHEATISASIKGELQAFITAATNEHKSDSIFKGQLHFSGQINTAKQFQAFVQSLNIDWHEPFAQLLGDPIGHTIASGIETFAGWLTSTARSTRTDISEYLQEEIKVTPSVYEQQNFFEKVDHLRSRSDRLNARIKQLKIKNSFPSRQDI